MVSNKSQLLFKVDIEVILCQDSEFKYNWEMHRGKHKIIFGIQGESCFFPAVDTAMWSLQVPEMSTF